MVVDDLEASEPVHDPLSISYIAVMCCGLAGALVLFLVFAVMPHAGDRIAAAPSKRPSHGKDRVSASVGARLDDAKRAGVQDVMSMHLDLKLPKGMTPDALDMKWRAGGGVVIHDAYATQYTGADGTHAVFYSPVCARARQTRLGEVAIVTRPGSTPLAVEGRLVIMAGGSSMAFPVSATIPPATLTLLGTVNVDDKGGPTRWFVPAGAPPRSTP